MIVASWALILALTPQASGDTLAFDPRLEAMNVCALRKLLNDDPGAIDARVPRKTSFMAKQK